MNDSFAPPPRSLLVVMVGGVFLLLWWIALQMLPAHDTPANFLFNAGFGTFTFLAGAVAIRRSAEWGGSRTVFGSALRAIGWGALLDGVALYIWTAYTFFGVEVPEVGFADAAWLLSYALYIRGMLRLTRTLPLRFNGARLFAAAAVPFIAVVGMVLVAGPLLRDPDILPTILNIAYFAMDMMLLALALVALVLWGGRLGAFALLVAVAYVDFVLADIAYLQRIAADVYYNGDVSDFLYAMACVLMAAAIVGYLPVPQPDRARGTAS